MNRTDHCGSSGKGLEVFEHQRAKAIHASSSSKAHRKQSSSAVALFLCSTSGRSCASRISLFSHLRTHPEKHSSLSVGSMGDSIIITYNSISFLQCLWLINIYILLFCFNRITNPCCTVFKLDAECPT